MSHSEGEKTGMMDNWTRSVEYSNEGMGKDMGNDDVSEECREREMPIL